MRRRLFFRPAARLQVVLSEELVADPNVAVLEFVKNAYDADATTAVVRFELGQRPVDGRLLIGDNGTGMDLEGIERDFMQPGYSGKADAEPSASGRVPVGEKGLGRLAAGRLGEQLDVYTRRGSEDAWLHLGFRWADFDDMDTPLDEVPVWVDDNSAPPELAGDKGTVVVISRLRMRWDARVPGRKVKGRATTRLGRLRQDLELLLLPLRAVDSRFDVDLGHNSPLPEDRDSSGPIEPPEMRLLDYQFDFALERDEDRWFVLRTVRRSDALTRRLSLERETNQELPAEEVTSQPLDLAALGSFDASVYYAPESGPQLQQIRAPVGVRLYRDGVRVDPYGEPGDDWLGVAARKASRQGHTGILPNALYGAVRISRRSNPELRPLANREGLLDNAALEALLVIAREQLRWFGDLVQQEYREPERERRRVQREGGEREAAALDVQRYAVAVTRATVHAVRQPVSAAGTELYRLQRTLETTEMPEDLRARLQQLHDRTQAHLQSIEDAVGRLMRFVDFDPTPSLVKLPEVVADVLARAKAAADSERVRLVNLVDGTQLTLEAPQGLVERSLEELVDNAIHATRPDGRAGEVVVGAAREEGVVRISVADNGSGVPPEIAERLFHEAISTEGNIGVGLLFNRRLLALARGDLLIAQTGPEGSRFEIILPT